MPTDDGRYGPARRLHEVRAYLDRTGGASIYDIAAELGVSTRTALRLVQALERQGEPLFEEIQDRRKIWRLLPSARSGTFTLTTVQMVSLYFSRRVFDFLAGTGLKEYLDEVFRKVEATLRRQDAAQVANLDRKFYDVNEAPHLYKGRADHVNALVSAVLKEQRLRVRHARVGEGKRAFLVDPYSLLVYKKGLYLAGYSHEHGVVRPFALDSLRTVEWLPGQSFEYPEDYHPEQLVEGAFGLIGGEPVSVRIRFKEQVARFVTRRKWHRTQKLRKVGHDIELSMEIQGATELKSWVLSFGDQAEVLEPESLRKEVGEELARAAGQYGRR